MVGLGLLLGMAAAHPAAAQVSLGSPGDPPRLAFGIGAFDVIPNTGRKDSRTAAEFRGEYRFGDVWSVVAPFVGGSVTSDGDTYAYFGFGFDIHFGPNWILTPNGAAGYFASGSGTQLGSWWEFRSGAELDYRFNNMQRIGVAVQHMSNAGLTKKNPGEESVTLIYTVPWP